MITEQEILEQLEQVVLTEEKDRQQILDEIKLLQDKIKVLQNETWLIQDKINLSKRAVKDQKQKVYALELQAEKEKKDQELDNAMQGIADLIINLIGNELPSLSKAHDYQYQDLLMTIKAYVDNLGGMLNANDMGLGKTFEAAIILFVLQKLFVRDFGRKPNIIWLTKKSLVIKDSTQKEINKWVPEFKIVTTKGLTSVKEREFALELYSYGMDIFIANYEFVRTTKKAVDKVEWDIVVIDEVHKLKGGANPSGPTAIFEACKEMAAKAKFKLFLSGTPMVNAAEEMWSYLHIFDPERFPSLKDFKKTFMAYKSLAKDAPLEVDPNKIMQQALRGRMIRRTQEEVGLQVPPLTIEILDVGHTPAQGAAYDEMNRRFFIWLEELDKMVGSQAIIAQLIRLRQINLWPVITFKQKVRDEFGFVVLDSEGKELIEETKLDIQESAKIDETMEIIENIGGKQIVIFCTFNDPMFEIQRRCLKEKITCGVLYGDTSDVDFEGDFQQGKLQVLCINSSMGEGLNLQKNPSEWPGGASYGIMLDKWWTPARNEQCIKRIVRQGSNIPVTFYVMHNSETVDDFIQFLNDEKEAAFGSIMNNKELRPKEEWIKLLKGLI